ncbi:FKBP-type peptidyl-prolyl cis-trans isomerase [Prevotella falsenii]|uniref:FKBP-type peptidyl-prolyl cis-trans isomerase n=1 Tax=Prevotella falsenii TaxID=515414 RepID=UPI00046A684B|nr:FKBP-type peptidyl-prolyl cis-trans isomerase [Prevotella falsenii]
MQNKNKLRVRLQSLFFSATLLFAAMFSVGLLSSCSEDEKENEEFANWKSKNTTYWTDLYNTTMQKIANGDTSWKLFLNYTYQGQTSNEGLTNYPPENYIIVHELEKGTGSGTPLFTDSVLVHYQGRLIPSLTYTAGLVFDSSWGGNGLVFNPKTSRPAQLLVGGAKGGVVDGFATALQKMHIGDHWVVYIPYQLGYGTTANRAIPAYSNLIFDLRLHSYYRAGTKVPDVI